MGESSWPVRGRVPQRHRLRSAVVISVVAVFSMDRSRPVYSRSKLSKLVSRHSQADVMAVAKQQAGARSDVADVRSAGIGATAPGGHPSMMYAPFPPLTGLEQAEQFVADRVAEGSDYLKIFGPSGTAGLWTMPSLGLDTITALTKAAHSRGLVVVAHVNSAADLWRIRVAWAGNAALFPC